MSFVVEGFLYEAKDGVATITIDNPGKMNSFSMEMFASYFDLLEKARDDPQVTVIIVTGRGKAFSVGAGLEVLNSVTSDHTAVFKNLRRSTLQSQATLIPKPIIAAVNGACAGLGFAIACMADIRFSTKSAKFSAAFSKRGLCAEWGISYILPRIVGMSNAMDILMSSRVFDGKEAKEMQLVSKVFETQEELMKETMKYALEMVDWCSPASLASIKKQLHDDTTQDATTAEENAWKLMSSSFQHPDSAEGIQSYIEKRKPKFQGLEGGSFHSMADIK